MKSKKYIILFLLAVVFSGCASQKEFQVDNSKDDFHKFIQNKSDSLWKVPQYIAKKMAEDSYVRGLSYVSDSNYAFAILEFEDALKYDKSATIYVSLADALMRLGFLDRALEAAYNAYKMDSTKVDALEIIFSIYVYKRDISSAEKVILKIYQMKPISDNLLMLGDFYSYYDQTKAIEYYKKYDSLNPTPDVKAIICKLYAQIGDTLSAIQGLKELAIANPNPYYAWEYFNMSFNANQYQNLYYCIDSLFNKYSSEDRANFLSSSIYSFYYSQELIKDSITDFVKQTLKKVVDNDYNLGEIFIPSFYLAYNLKDTNLLKSLLNKSIILADTISEIPVTAAQFYESIGERDSSIALLKKYIKKFPDNQRYYIQLGYSYFLENDWENAKNYLLEGYSMNTTNYNVLVSLGDVYDKLNKVDSAEYYYKLALKMNSNDPLVNNNYAYFLSRDQKQLEYALELSKLSINSEPENAAYLDTYAWILFKMNKIDSALEYLQRAYSIDSTNYDIMEHLGDVYESKQIIEKAIEYWEKSAGINPNNKELLKKINKYRK
ncbi:MAG TPA: tetratricopeptide repeat protein [Bacteroidota bacterium]|nr:tetratricopeptide repeat protein [Candidatus Kapabacteria bacterium]HRS00978.1 tetratricopeptide repeat protein [Bacteroidota bacterium]HRT67530.1 tetratricopeptide repeat protein [Bacteroidota bacterium]